MTIPSQETLKKIGKVVEDSMKHDQPEGLGTDEDYQALTEQEFNDFNDWFRTLTTKGKD